MNIQQGILNVEVKDKSSVLKIGYSLFNVHYWIFLLLFTIFYGCKKEQAPVIYMGYDYFPSNVGHYVIYQCDSVYYNPYSSNTPRFDTEIYQIKEVIDSIYPDNEGRPTMRIVRYKRLNVDSATPWSSIVLPEKVWSGNLLSTTAQRVEDNYRYIKLLFPVSLNATWNGNAYNVLGTDNYLYTSVNAPATIGTTHFDSTLTVFQLSNSTLLQFQYYQEQYAAGVGLVYKEVIDYSTNKLAVTIPIPPDSATSGTIYYTETYLSSGNQ